MASSAPPFVVPTRASARAEIAHRRVRRAVRADRAGLRARARSAPPPATSSPQTIRCAVPFSSAGAGNHRATGSRAASRRSGPRWRHERCARGGSWAIASAVLPPSVVGNARRTGADRVSSVASSPGRARPHSSKRRGVRPRRQVAARVRRLLARAVHHALRPRERLQGSTPANSAQLDTARTGETASPTAWDPLRAWSRSTLRCR